MSIATHLKNSLEKHGAGAKKSAPEKKSHKVHEMRIRHGDTGGFVIEHHQETQDEYPHMKKESEHVAASKRDLISHVKSNMCCEEMK